MAITKIELSPLWQLRYQKYHNLPYSVLVVDDPYDPDREILSYSTTSSGFGTVLRYSDVLSRACRDDVNTSITIRYDQSSYSSYSDRALLRASYLDDIPTGGTFSENDLSEGAYSYDLPENGRGTNYEIDISSMRPVLAFDGYGINFDQGGYIVGIINNIRLILEGNWVPNTPTLETPTGGVLRDRTKPIEFKWVHSGIYPQNKYELRYRVKGTSTWTTITATSTSQTHTLPANTLTANEYEWQVRTTMSDGTNEATSPWSSIGIFNATNETNAPSIQSPTNGQTLPTQNLTVQWASVPNQTQINVELIRNGKRVQQITRTQSSNSVTLNGWLDNNQSYIVRLRVLASGQLWSDWAEVNINVSYTQPARPTLNIIPDQDNANLLIRINNPPPTGTYPTPVRQVLFKREIGGSWIKLANLLPNSDYVDYAVASGQQYEYRVTVYADNDTSVTSNVFRNSIEIDQTVINVANESNIFIKLDIVRERSALSELNATRKQFAGRRFPVTEFGETVENNIEIESLIESRADYDYLVNMINRQETLIYRDARGRKMYATVSGLTVVDESLGRYSVSMAFSQVDYKEGID